MEEYEKALVDFEKVVELKKDYYFAYASLGAIYYMKEEWEEAASNFLKAYAHEEEVSSYALLAAVCLKRAGMDAEAEEYLTEVMTQYPRDEIDYHLCRLFIERKYDSTFLFELEKVQDSQKRAVAVFFYGLYYLLQEQTRLGTHLSDGS